MAFCPYSEFMSFVSAANNRDYFLEQHSPIRVCKAVVGVVCEETELLFEHAAVFHSGCKEWTVTLLLISLVTVHVLAWRHTTFLDAFAKLRKRDRQFRRVRVCFRTERFDFRWTHFRDTEGFCESLSGKFKIGSNPFKIPGSVHEGVNYFCIILRNSSCNEESFRSPWADLGL
jgi:hypothetical protein